MTEQLETRVRSLEEWRHVREIEEGKSDLRRQHMDERFDRLEGQMKSMNSNSQRFFWLIISLVVAAVANFIMSGGLDV